MEQDAGQLALLEAQLVPGLHVADGGGRHVPLDVGRLVFDLRAGSEDKGTENRTEKSTGPVPSRKPEQRSPLKGRVPGREFVGERERTAKPAPSE